ncbi:MAG: RNA polymerase sigma factor [Bacteroidales bacterium]
MSHDLTNIVKACKKGDKKSQKLLYDIFSPRLYGLCLRYSSDEHEAKDLLQEGFIKIFSKLNQYKNQGSLEGWMKRIVINTAMENFRKSNNLILRHSDIHLENTHVKYEHVLEELNSKDLLRMIQSLSPQYRAVFNLYAIEGYNHQEIAHKLNISEGTSKSNLSRAREMLKKKINKDINIKLTKVI